jgi:hypothetical protein
MGKEEKRNKKLIAPRKERTANSEQQLYPLLYKKKSRKRDLFFTEIFFT